MSHVVSITTEIRDVEALRASCKRLQLNPPVQATARLFSSEATGQCVRLPEWRYPVVCELESGQVRYDNFNGLWGAQFRLDQLMQAYAVEMSKLEARRQGYSVTEQPLVDGSIKLTIHVGGEA